MGQGVEDLSVVCASNDDSLIAEEIEEAEEPFDHGGGAKLE
jgi:hypothetical protein